MRRRTKRGFWTVLLLVLAAGFLSRSRTNGPTCPADGDDPPRAMEKTPRQRPPPAGRTGGVVARPEPPRAPPARRDDEQRLRLRVVGVHDGDTLTGLDDGKTQHKIRLDAIDAPELGQPHGQAAKRALSGKVFGKDVVVVPKVEDKYGRTVGQVLLGDRDVNLEMIAEGMAWHYKKYDDTARLADAERAARAAGRGLWRDPEPVPPWDWRRGQRPAAPRRPADDRREPAARS